MGGITGAILGVDPEQAQRKKDLADTQRKNEISKYMGVSNNIHKQLALLMNPDTMQPMPGKEAQVAQLRQNLGQVDSYIQNLYNPNFDVGKGAMTESPIHKLGDILHVTKQPANTKPVGEQIKDLKDISDKYATEPSLLTADEQKKSARINAGLEPKAVEPKPEAENWKPQDVTLKDGTKRTLMYNSKANEWQDLAGNPVSKDLLAGANAAPKQTAQRPPSKYDQQWGLYLKSIGKTPETATWRDQVKFIKEANPYGAAHLGIAYQTLALAKIKEELMENQQDWQAFLAINKQLAPMEKIQSAAERSDEYVKNPSGEGDIALVFAFIEATKPASGFRFTETERKWITGARGLIEGAETRINAGFTGETLSPEQRQHMSDIIKNAGTQVQQESNNLLAGAARFHPKSSSAVNPNNTPPPNGGTKKKVSLKAAMAKPFNKGKTADQVREDLKAHNYDVIEDAK